MEELSVRQDLQLVNDEKGRASVTRKVYPTKGALEVFERKFWMFCTFHTPCTTRSTEFNNYGLQQLDWSASFTKGRLAQIDLFGENGAVRDAIVQRYKEKRRTRLFSKKIRYQVRKVNADQRPRMKGRFVRRSSSSGSEER